MRPQIAPSSPEAPQPSPWHSPVPYLFGGLAAIMGLIAFALFILACSYWKLSGYFDNHNGDIESANGNGGSLPENHNDRKSSDMEEKYFVIMAGEAKPTYLATPSSSRTMSFGSSSWRSNSTTLTEKSSSWLEMSEEARLGSSDLVQGRNTENYESADHLPSHC